MLQIHSRNRRKGWKRDIGVGEPSSGHLTLLPVVHSVLLEARIWTPYSTGLLLIWLDALHSSVLSLCSSAVVPALAEVFNGESPTSSATPQVVQGAPSHPLETLCRHADVI